MDKFLGTDIPDLEARKRFLKDNCDKVEEKGYMKQFSPEKVQEMKEQLSQVSIEIDDIEEEKKDANELFKIRLKPVLTEKKELLKGIRERAEYVTEVCYTIIDQSERMVGSYNAEGQLISERPAMPKELQGTIHQVMRTGTHD